MTTLKKKPRKHMKKLFDTLRPFERDMFKRHTGVDLYKGERFSRHARKRLKELVDKGFADDLAKAARRAASRL